MNPDLKWAPSLKLREGEGLLITLQKKRSFPCPKPSKISEPLTVEIII